MATVGTGTFFLFKKTFKDIARIHNLKIRISAIRKKKESAIHGLSRYFFRRIFVRIRIRPKNRVDCQP